MADRRRIAEVVAALLTIVIVAAFLNGPPAPPNTRRLDIPRTTALRPERMLITAPKLHAARQPRQEGDR